MGGQETRYNPDGTIAQQKLGPSGQMPNFQDFSKSQQVSALASALSGSKQFQEQARQGANQIGTNFNQFVPTLNTNFQARPGLDQFSQGLLSAGQQQIARNLAGTQNQISRQVQGPAAGVLRSQAATQSRLNANPLLFQVGAQQVGRQQQEQQLGNQALLAQQGAYNTGLSASNAATAQKVGLQGLPVAAQQNLVSVLQSTSGKG